MAHPLQLEYGGKPRSFLLRIGELRELQRECDNRGPLSVLSRLITPEWTVDEVYQTIRLGLIGGGASQFDAKRIADYYCANKADWQNNALVAGLILRHSVIGEVVENDPLVQETESPSTSQNPGTSESSTDAPPPSG